VTRLFPAFLLSGLLCQAALGQSTLTLDDCLVMARERSPQLKSVQNSLRSSVLAREEIATGALPQIKLVADPMLAPATTRFGYDPAVTDGGQISAQLSLTQSLYDAGIRGLRSDQTDLDQRRFGTEQRRVERDLTFSVKQAFFETMKAQEQAELLAQSVRRLQEYLELVMRLSAGGSATTTDVLKTRVQLTNATVALEEARDDYAVRKYALAALIGATIDTTFSLRGSWNLDRADSLLNAGAADTRENLDLTVAGLTVQRGLLDVDIARRERLPVLSLTADFGYLSSGDNLRVLPPDHYRSMGFSLGLSFELPLVTWGATSLRVQQRELDVENLRLGTELLRRSVVSETQQTRLQILRLRPRLSMMRQNLQWAEQNFLLAKAKYAGGGTLSLEVLDAQQLLTDARVALLSSQAALQVLLAKFEQLTTR